MLSTYTVREGVEPTVTCRFHIRNMIVMFLRMHVLRIVPIGWRNRKE